jgi:phenylalanyl-tRNA synthetase beta chain
MKITRDQLQKYFAAPLPEMSALADAFTFHAFEIDSIEGDVLDIKVLPNRAADCATPLGVAHELSAILDLPLMGAGAPSYVGQPTVSVTALGLQAILGADIPRADMLDVFRRLQFKVAIDGDVMQVTAPAPRNDIVILEDVAEEIGQILGYERIAAKELPPLATEPDQARYRGIERMKDQLVAQGYSEISTQSFAKKGDIILANPLDKSKPALRTSLEENLQDALVRAKLSAPLVLAPQQKPKLFEVGSVFLKSGEYLELRMTERVKEWGDAAGISDNLTVAKLEDYGKDYEPVRYELSAYKPFSLYPFITRDISMWIIDSDAARGTVFKLFGVHGAGLLQQVQLLDQFTNKEGRQSLAFRLIFQSFERTLTDDEVNGIMANITTAVVAQGYEVR